MTLQYKGRYGFELADERCIGECEDNPLIIPRLYRYQGMGHYEILADVKDHPDKCFLIHVGGSNGYEQRDSHDALLKLTEKDALPIDQLEAKLKGSFWVEIVGSVSTDIGIEIDQCVEHTGDE